MDHGLRRDALIDGLIREGYLRSDRVIWAMKRIPREAFLPEGDKGSAYYDSPQPLGFGQTISAPHMVAIMTELLDVKPHSRILEVGTGSGYQAAVLSMLAKEGSIVSLERVPQLASRARGTLRSLDLSNVLVVDGDGTLGAADWAPYDRIIVTAAAPNVPKCLLEQLRRPGKMLVPVGSRFSQTLMEFSKDRWGNVKHIEHGGCVFVPLIGELGW